MAKPSQASVVLLALLTGCGWLERPEGSFPSMASALSAGAVSSGWVPAWLPSNALTINTIHDIDTNESALVLDLPPGASWQPPSDCRLVPPSAVIPSRFEPSRWPSRGELASSFRFYACPTDIPPTSVFVGILNTGQRVVHWRVTAR